MTLNVKHHSDFGTIRDGLVLYILMIGFSCFFRYWLGRRSLDDER